MRTATEFKIKSGQIGKAVELERKIDDAIDAAAAFGAEEVKVATTGYPAAVISRVLADYEEAGWRTERTIDPRDGDYISLVPR